MEPKAQARTESDGIAPLTYCSDMQIPSFPLKTKSTSTFKANFGFIVHVAPRSTAAQHSWLAHTPADGLTLYQGARPLHPESWGVSSEDAALQGTETQKGGQKSREEDRDPWGREEGGRGGDRDPERGTQALELR